MPGLVCSGCGITNYEQDEFVPFIFGYIVEDLPARRQWLCKNCWFGRQDTRTKEIKQNCHK